MLWEMFIRGLDNIWKMKTLRKFVEEYLQIKSRQVNEFIKLSEFLVSFWYSQIELEDNINVNK